MRKEGIRRKTICLRTETLDISTGEARRKRETEEEKQARRKRVDTKIAVIQYLEDLIKKLRDEAVREM